MGNNMNRHFSKEDVQLANKHTRRCSISQGNCKSTMKYHFTSRWLLLKKNKHKKQKRK